MENKRESRDEREYRLDWTREMFRWKKYSKKERGEDLIEN